MTDNDSLREYLTRKLMAQRPAMATAGDYYAGTQRLQFLDPEIARSLQDRVRTLRVNFARLVVDVLAQRCTVTGFASRSGGVADEALWALWQANNLDEASAMVHTDALVHGRSYYLAWTGPDGAPRITAESALQCAVHRDPLTGEITAALKRWTGDDGHSHSLVFTADEVAHYISTGDAPTDPLLAERPVSFMAEDMALAEILPNPIGVVPMVALVNRPRLGLPDGESELVDVAPLIDAITKLSTDLMIASEYSASPRRWVTGLYPDLRTPTGEQMEEIREQIRQHWEKARASSFLVAPDARTEFGQFDVASLGNYETAISLLTSQIAAIAALPPHYVSSSHANPTSADAIRASEARLTAKARQRHAQWSGPYEDLMRLAVTIRDGRPDPGLVDLETRWASAEPDTLAQTADAEAKLVGAGIVDRRAALVELGFSPLDIERMLSTGPEEVTT